MLSDNWHRTRSNVQQCSENQSSDIEMQWKKKKFCSISSISFRRMDSNLRQRDTSKFNSKDLAPSENGDDSSRKSRSSSNSSNSSKKSRSSSSSSNRSTKMKPSMKKKAQKTPKAFKLLLFTIVLSKCLDFNIVDSLLVSLALIVALWSSKCFFFFFKIFQLVTTSTLRKIASNWNIRPALFWSCIHYVVWTLSHDYQRTQWSFHKGAVFYSRWMDKLQILMFVS